MKYFSILANKILFFIVIFAISSLNPLYSQFDFEEDTQSEETSYEVSDFSYGLFLEAKAGLNAGDVINGRKNFVVISSLPSFGLVASYRLSQNYNLAINGEIAFSDNSYGLKIYKDNSMFEFSHSYITLASTFSFTYFQIGFGFGIPVSSSYITDIPVENQNYLAEFKMLGQYPIFEDATGTLNIHLKVGYFLSGIYTDYGKYDPIGTQYPALAPDKITNKYNPHPVTMALGMSWMFNYGYKIY